MKRALFAAAVLPSLAACMSDPAGGGSGSGYSGVSGLEPSMQPAVYDPGLVDAMNAARASYGLTWLMVEPALTRAAERHLSYLAARGSLTHQGQGNTRVGDRVTAEGYTWCFVAENLGQAYYDAASMTEGWLNSPGHRENLLAPQALYVGTARTGSYWAAVYAAPC